MTLALVFKTLVSIKRSLGFVRQVAQETLSFLIPGFSGKFSRCDSDQTGGAILQLVRHYKNVACRTVCSQPPSTSLCESIFLLHLYLHINQAVFGWQNNDTPPVCHGIVHIDVLSETAGEQHKIRKKTNFIFCFKTEDSIFGQQSSKKPQSNKIITPMCVPKKCYQRRKVSLIKKDHRALQLQFRHSTVKSRKIDWNSALQKLRLSNRTRAKRADPSEKSLSNHCIRWPSHLVKHESNDKQRGTHSAALFECKQQQHLRKRRLCLGKRTASLDVTVATPTFSKPFLLKHQLHHTVLHNLIEQPCFLHNRPHQQFYKYKKITFRLIGTSPKRSNQNLGTSNASTFRLYFS